MKVLSVNISSGHPIELAGEQTQTGIFKRPTNTAVRVGTLGLESDFIADLKHHGGPDQAVYLYSMEDYKWWQDQLGRELSAGLFGENLTIDSFKRPVDQIKSGDRYTIGDSLELEVTCARVPCAKLGKVMGDNKFVKQFIKAQRPGIYTRVIQEGQVKKDDTIHYQPTNRDGPGVMDLFNLFYTKEKDPNLIHQLLETPMDQRGKSYLLEMLEKL